MEKRLITWQWVRMCITADGRVFLTIPTRAAAPPAAQVDAFNQASFTVQSEPRRGLSNSFRHWTCEGLSFSINLKINAMQFIFQKNGQWLETFVHSNTNVCSMVGVFNQFNTIKYNTYNQRMMPMHLKCCKIDVDLNSITGWLESHFFHCSLCPQRAAIDGKIWQAKLCQPQSR